MLSTVPTQALPTKPFVAQPVPSFRPPPGSYPRRIKISTKFLASSTLTKFTNSQYRPGRRDYALFARLRRVGVLDVADKELGSLPI
jgi:hypothetical protein